jgi:GDP-L-fucose synthase
MLISITDAAKAIVDATILYDKPDPVNIGTGIEISIKELVSTIKNIMDYNGTIIWDTSQPNGQPRRCLDVSKSKNEFGFTSRIPLIAGLEQTIQWYLKSKTKQTTIN